MVRFKSLCRPELKFVNPIPDMPNAKSEMSFLLCPLCGKNASMQHLHPSQFDDAIYAQEVQGLGKGKGFKMTGRVSILHGGEVKSIILPRLIGLVKLCMDEGVISYDEVRIKLGLSDVEQEVAA